MVQSTLPLGSYDPTGPMVLEVSVMAKNAESQWENHKAGPLRFGEKVMLPKAENYIFKNQFLASYRGQVILVEVESSTIGHK